MKKREKYFKTTSCKDKRSIVRCLNTFRKKFKYILCNQEEIDLDVESMKFFYADKIDNKKEKNIVYSIENANIELKKTNEIIKVIDNLISINRKKELKENLKEIVKLRDFNGLNSFFVNESISLNQISQYIEDETYAIKIFNQIKNRILFEKSGIYSNNGNTSKIKNRIKTNLTSHNETISLQVEYIIDNLWLFEEDTIKRVEEVMSKVNEDEASAYYNPNYVPTENNTSYFHPIDEETYLDPESTPEARTASMTDALYLREVHDMYEPEIYDDYHSFVSNYDDLTQEVLDLIKIVLKEYESYSKTKELDKLEKQIMKKLLNYDVFYAEKFEEYLDKPSNELVNDILEAFPKFDLIKDYFDLADTLERIELNKDEFLIILDNFDRTDYDLFEGAMFFPAKSDDDEIPF